MRECRHVSTNRVIHSTGTTIVNAHIGLTVRYSAIHAAHCASTATKIAAIHAMRCTYSYCDRRVASTESDSCCALQSAVKTVGIGTGWTGVDSDLGLEAFTPKSSSQVTPYNSAIVGNIEMSGDEASRSQLLTVLLETLHFSATSCWVYPFFFRNADRSCPIERSFIRTSLVTDIVSSGKWFYKDGYGEFVAYS